MEIRKAEIGDLPVMAKLGRYFHDISDYGKVQSYDELKVQDTVLSVMNSNGGLVLTAWDEDRMVGLLAGIVIGSFYNSNELIAQCIFVAVIPEYQRKSVSSKMEKMFEEWGVSLGAEVVLYDGYSKKFIEAKKRKGFKVGSTTLLKRLKCSSAKDAVPVAVPSSASIS
jgi:hypothetical protein